MAKILVVHGDRDARKLLVQRAGLHHQVTFAQNLAKATKLIASNPPALLIVGLDPKKPEAIDLLRYLRRSRVDLPVIIVGEAAAGVLQPVAMKLGAAAVLEYPVEQAALDQAISKALQLDKDAHGATPPICREELEGNRSELQKQLNRHMVCFAGRNQVYIQSMILGGGKTSKPRIALKCAIRKQFGHPPNVYYEYVRDVCCGDPTGCPAYQEFQAKYTA